MKIWHFLPAFVFLLSGCESGQESRQVESASKLGQQVAEAIHDLSDRLDVQSGEIKLVTEKAVTWRDGSLGCPKEGMMYTQALVEGTLIVLRVDGRDYQYHSGKGRRPFYCEHPEKPAAKRGAD